jgi:hypothetical protein
MKQTGFFNFITVTIYITQRLETHECLKGVNVLNKGFDRGTV